MSAAKLVCALLGIALVAGGVEAASASFFSANRVEGGGVMVAVKKKAPAKNKNKAKGKAAESGGKAGAKTETKTETKTEVKTDSAAKSDGGSLNFGAGGGGAAAPVLDLSNVESDAKSKQELLKAPEEKTEKKGVKKKGGGFDFGGGVDLGLGKGEAVDFGSELGEFDIGKIDVNSPERDRFEKANSLMSSEEYTEAALEFRYFLDDPKYAEFQQESQYQLAKALYKLGFLDSSLKRFKQILEQGQAHKRFKKSIEWLFFISRKMADETPVLAELARFRNVTFPKAYRNEYRYLLSKYLFVQAQRLEVERLQQEQLERSKKAKENNIDFSAAAEATKGGIDFGAGDGGSGFDFGGGDKGGGGFDFGGGDKGGGGFDFGGGGKGGGGFDFGSSEPSEGPVRDAAPTTTKEALNQGLDFVVQVEKESKFYARAKYLEGLLRYLNSEDQKAVQAFQEVVRVLNPRAGARLDPKLRELAFLSLARIHYGYKQFDRAVYYYDLIDRDSENWLTALFEASWGYYRRGDFEKALGNLLTLHSPFFEREYFPESQIVKAIIYFEACRYPETRQIVDDFIQRFSQVMKEVERITKSQEAPELLYDRIVQMQNAGKAEAGESGAKDEDVTLRVVGIALADPEIRTARDVVKQNRDQQELWKKMSDKFRTGKAGAELIDELKQNGSNAARQAGEVTRKRFEQELYALKSLLAQSLRIKLEVARAEREVLERKLRNEGSGEELVPAAQRTVVDDEHLYWPYEGEYWRDELGTYELDFSMCRPLAAAE